MTRVTESNSGVNWTGPSYEGTHVRIQVGYEWPDKANHLMCWGSFESAQAERGQIERWAKAHDVDLASHALGGKSILDCPIDGVTELSWGFRTEVEIERRDREFARKRAEYEANLLLGYRKNGETCSRRDTLEQVVSTKKPDGWLLKSNEEVAIFMNVISS